MLPPFCSSAEEEIRRLSSALERHRIAGGRTAWHWWPQHRQPSGLADGSTYSLVLDATITLLNTGVDWLELALDIAWRTPEQLTVNAAVEVACWCPMDHNIHQVRGAEWHVNSSAELTNAFAGGTTMLLDVLDSGPYEPGPWRTASHLPDAP
jgi:hypothetical protein